MLDSVQKHVTTSSENVSSIPRRTADTVNDVDVGKNPLSEDGFLREYQACFEKLRFFALTLVDSDTDADDLLQETFMRAWQARNSFTKGTHFSAWMKRILRNTFLSQARRRQNYREKIKDLEGAHSGGGEGDAYPSGISAHS